MTSMDPALPDRVLLLRTGDNQLAAVTPGRPTKDWQPLAKAAFEAVATHLFDRDGAPAQNASVRHFVMRPEDLRAWDTLQRRGQGGYSYGSLWNDTGIHRNVQIKEVPPPASASGALPPFDPLAVATALAVAQMQADIRRLTALVEQMAQDVKAILQFLRLEQEAEVLAATETIDEVYARYRAEHGIGSTDWDRLAGLEHVLKKQHRQLISELHTVADTLGFTSVDQATAVEAIEAERVQNLIHLEWYLLRSLKKWGELMLARKADRRENSLSAAQEVRRLGEQYVDDAREALQRIKNADSVMAGRSAWARLFSTDGIVLGAYRDGEAASAACARRTQVQALTAVRKRLPASVAAGPARLELEAAPPSPVTVMPTSD
ncbi:hypothetical protein ACI78Q_00340 [Geodermatophilus sp. SYSU D00705]